MMVRQELPLMPAPRVGDDPLAFDKEPCVSGTAAASRMEPKIWVQWTRNCCVRPTKN